MLCHPIEVILKLSIERRLTVQDVNTNYPFANGDPVDSCDKFEYLGVPTSNAETVFRSRLSKAWVAATKLRSIFNSKANDY